MNGYASPLKLLGSTYQTLSHTWMTNPATGAAWTQAEVNALQAGVQKYELNAFVDSETRVTQVYVTVAFDVATYTYADGPTGMNTLTSVARNGATTTYTWDGNGNVASKFGATKTCYGWTPEGLLSNVKTVASAFMETGTQVQAYAYDGLGRRVRVDGASASTWTVSIVSGMDVIFEKFHVDGQADPVRSRRPPQVTRKG